jgi:hypothetical protein
MPEFPPRIINRYYENYQSERERDKASNRPLVEETDVVEFFKHLGFQATVYQERLLRDKSQFILARWSTRSPDSCRGSDATCLRVRRGRGGSRFGTGLS